MSTTQLIDQLNTLVDTPFSKQAWSSILPHVIAVTPSGNGLVTNGLLLLPSLNRKVGYFYFNNRTKKFVLEPTRGQS